MELTHDFQVRVPVARVWELFKDLSRIVPSMPGAALDGVEDGVYLGNVKVKVGPVTAQYKGKARFVTCDEVARKVVVRAEGRDTRGQGNARAIVTAVLAEVEGGTRVEVVNDLAITGRVAQIGRGLIADVSGKLLSQFVDNLEAQLGDAPGDGPPSTTAEEPAAAVDLVAAAAVPLVRRLLPLLIVGAAVVALLYLVMRSFAPR